MNRGVVEGVAHLNKSIGYDYSLKRAGPLTSAGPGDL